MNVRIVAIAVAAIVFIALVAIYMQSFGKSPTTWQSVTSTTIASSITSTSAYTISQQQASLATPSTTTPIPSASSLKIAITTDLSALDIHFAKAVADFEVLGKVYEALFKIVWNGSRLAYIPWLVKEYKQVNETAWLFVLRDNIYFHNGKKLTAEDVKYSLLRSLRLSGIGKQLLTDASGNPVIRDIVVVNDTALILVLSSPFTPLFENLAHLSTAIMPKEIALKYWNGPINSTEDIIGTGPYRFVSYERGSKVVLQVFDGYWGKKPSVRELVYMVMPDANTRIAAIASGSVDIAVGISPDMVDYLKSKGVEVIRAPGVRLVLVAINCERVPDARVRQALNYAIDKEAIVSQLLKGYATTASSVASPVFPNVYSFEPYTYNTTLARRMLEEAGFVGKKLTLLVSTRSPMDLQLAQVVKYYLEAVGLDVEIVQMEHTAFLKKVFTDHDFDLAIYGPSPSSLYYALTYWRTGTSLNGPKYSNPYYDKLLDEIAKEVNDSRRAELYRQAQETLWRDAPAIWLYYEDILIAVKPNVKGLQVLPFQMLVVDNVTVG